MSFNSGGPKLHGVTTYREVILYRDKLMMERKAVIAKERAMNPRSYTPNHLLDVPSHFPAYEAYMTMTMKGQGLTRKSPIRPPGNTSSLAEASPSSLLRAQSSPGLSRSSLPALCVPLESPAGSERAGSALGSNRIGGALRTGSALGSAVGSVRSGSQAGSRVAPMFP